MAAPCMMPSSCYRQCLETGKLPSCAALPLDRRPLLTRFQRRRHTASIRSPTSKFSHCCKASAGQIGSRGSSGRNIQEASLVLPKITGQHLQTFLGKFAQGAAVAALALVLVSYFSINTCSCDSWPVTASMPALLIVVSSCSIWTMKTLSIEFDT